MGTPSRICFVLAGLVASSLVCREATAADEVGATTTAREKGVYPGHTRKIAGEIDLGVGLGIAHAGLGVGPVLHLGAGARFRLKRGSLAVGLRGAWQRYTADGTGELPCVEGEEDPCISPDDGAYDWAIVENVGQLSLPITYQFLHAEKRFVPYLTVAPAMFLLGNRVDSFSLTNKQFGLQGGFQASVGGIVRVGPGGFFLEAGYQWAPLEHRSTGPGNVGAVVLALGYRFVL